MGIITTLNPTLSGGLLALSMLYILNYLVTRKDRIQLLYSVIGVIAAIYILMTTYLHQQKDLYEFSVIGKLTVLMYLILMQLIFYITYYLNKKIHWLPYLMITGVTSGVILFLFFLDKEFMYQKGVYIDCLFIAGESYYYLKGETSDFYNFSVLIFYFSSLIYFIYYLFRSTLEKSSSEYQIHFIVFFLFLGSNIYDVLIDVGIITSSIFISEYAILLIVILFQVDLIKFLYKENIQKEKLLKLSKNFHNLIQDINLYVIGFDYEQSINFVNSFSNKHLKNVTIRAQLQDIFINDNWREFKTTSDLVSLETKNNRVIECSFITFNTSEQDQQSYIIGYDVTQRNLEHEKLEKTLEQLKKITLQLEEENLDLKIVSKQSNKPNELFVDNFITSLEKEVKRVANYKSTVLIEGAIGTGKKHFANLLIEESNRIGKQSIVYNCHRSIKSIFKAEYYESNNTGFGKSILDVVHHGTLVLVDIENMSREDQEFLLDLLKDENSKYDIRFIVTTTKDLKRLTINNDFNTELYQYLSLYKINLPELKNRTSDIPYLVKLFVEAYCKKNHIPSLTVSLAIIKKLQLYHWPENLKELKYIIQKAAISSKGKSLKLKNFEEYIKEKQQEKPQFLSLEDFEKEYIVKILIQTNWKISGKNSASEILQINEATLRSKMKKLSIQRK